jgi:hypothetical protein
MAGLKKDISQIKKQSFETPIHEDVEKLGGKIDKIYWVLLAAAGTAVLFVADKTYTLNETYLNIDTINYSI